MKSLTRLFDADWNSPDAAFPSDLGDRLIVGPEEARDQMTSLLLGAERSIRIVDHKLTDPALVTLLKERRKDGITVDVKGETHVAPLLAHGKLIVVDERTAVIGSMALSALTLGFRREVAVTIHHPNARSRAERVLSLTDPGRPTRAAQGVERISMRIPVLLALAAGSVLLAGPAAAQSTSDTPTVAASAAKEAKQAAQKDDGFRVKLTPRPGLRVGDAFKVDLKALFQFDVRGFDPIPDNQPDDWNIPRRRVGIDGELFKVIEFQVEAQLDDPEPWRDVYVNYKPRTWLQLQGGKFKVPYGRERLRGHSSLDFLERSNVTNYLTPGRDIGGMVHGHTAGRAFDYAVGFFAKDSASKVKLDPDAADEEDDIASPKSTMATRIVLRPFRFRDREGFGGLRDRVRHHADEAPRRTQQPAWPQRLGLHLLRPRLRRGQAGSAGASMSTPKAARRRSPRSISKGQTTAMDRGSQTTTSRILCPGAGT